MCGLASLMSLGPGGEDAWEIGLSNRTACAIMGLLNAMRVVLPRVSDAKVGSTTRGLFGLGVGGLGKIGRKWIAVRDWRLRTQLVCMWWDSIVHVRLDLDGYFEH